MIHTHTQLTKNLDGRSIVEVTTVFTDPNGPRTPMELGTRGSGSKSPVHIMQSFRRWSVQFIDT